MSSPFPGMDPYLERAELWPAVQHQLVAAFYQLLLPGLVDHYRLRVGVRDYATELALFTSVVREKHAEEYLEIRSRADGRLVTRVEFVSIANRTTDAGRKAYLAARAEAHLLRAATVEIDLITQGTPVVQLPKADLPPHDQLVSVTRSVIPLKVEAYPTTVEHRLAKFRLPLAPDDRDAVVDLQVVFGRAAGVNQWAKLVDHAAELPAGVSLCAPGLAFARRVAGPARSAVENSGGN